MNFFEDWYKSKVLVFFWGWSLFAIGLLLGKFVF